MLETHSDFYLSQPSIYFGINAHSDEDHSPKTHEKSYLNFGITLTFFSSGIQQTPGMILDWYDLLGDPVFLEEHRADAR